MDTFNWLHLTDLHWGVSGQKPLWPTIREKFFEDLAALHAQCGPWQVVLFSGDFVQQGASAEYAELEEKVLGPLWECLGRLGPQPALLAVPGNHDLERPDGKSLRAAVTLLKTPGMFAGEVAEEFWRDAKSEYRRVIDKAFANYKTWWDKRPHGGGQTVAEGLLPGDFSTSFETPGGQRIGVVGLNTTFLQLAGGDYRGRLAWHVEQLNRACGGDGAGWVKQHDVCLLMTHQGPEWLDEASQQAYAEVNPAGRFAVHLFGHMHEVVIRGESFGGGEWVRKWQGPSLFGLEQYGEDKKLDRRHGYAAGSLRFEENQTTLRHWPRKAIYDRVNGWRFDRDVENCVLQDDGATRPDPVWQQGQSSEGTTGGNGGEERIEQIVARTLANYHQHAQRDWRARWSEVIGDDDS